MKITNLFLPFDVFIRHKFSSRFLRGYRSVLDVGGSLREIKKFVKVDKFKTADIQKGADILFDGTKLPLKDNSFEVVISLDTLEHIKKNNRKDFTKELLRVAEKKVILAAPLGTKKHIAFEKNLIKKLKAEKKKIPNYLKEHIVNGLPVLEEIKDLVSKEYSWKIYFSGNLNFTDKLFRLHLFETRNPIFNRLFYYFKFLINLTCNLFLYSVLVNLPFSQSINRFYLIIKKEKNN